MTRRQLALGGLISLGLAATAWAASIQSRDAQPWRQAAPSYRFEFPKDHASHPDFKLEWWYYTGNLRAQDGRRFGYQLTFFRVGVEARPANPSRWAVRDLFLAHFAVTDISARRFRFSDRVNRTGVGLAGAATDSYHVWNEDWDAVLAGGRHMLRARTDDLGLALALEEGKPPVAHGSEGISQKGDAAGNASHYYSLTRMPTRGTLTIDGTSFAVEGTSWMDHEFGTTFLEAQQRGWNWFALQLDEQTDVMLYDFMREDGSRDIHSSGTLIDRSGKAVPLRASQFQLEPLARWRSPTSGATYPTAWRVRVPEARLDLKVTALVDDQELRTQRSTGVTYWEGAIDVSGTRAGRPVTGQGYLEMTGYTGESLATALR